jgi:hypothetical protein
MAAEAGGVAMSLCGRLDRLERSVDDGRCRRCGGRHVPDLATLMQLSRAEADLCACRCCGWVAELAAKVAAPA